MKIQLRHEIGLAVFGCKISTVLPFVRFYQQGLSVGLDREVVIQEEPRFASSSTPPFLLASQTAILQRLFVAAACNLVPLLTGPRLCGKSSVVDLLARCCDTKLHVIRLTCETDAQDLLGSYEQVSLTWTTNFFADY